MNSTASLLQAAQEHLYQNYRKPSFVLNRGEGSWVYDTDGRRYLDFCAGIATCTLGHSHPNMTKALADQATRLMHVSNYYYNEPNIRAAKELTRVTGYERALFCNSGTEAIEASLKLARRYFSAQGQPERFRVIAFTNSFHGRTMGALAVTGQPGYREGFGPLVGASHVPYGDIAAVANAVGPDVAAVIVEPVQGEGGVLPAPAGFLSALREMCDDEGILLLADEVQSGICRTGRWLAFEHSGVKADVTALAKGLGGGFPIGAMLCDERLAAVLPPGSHGTTFGGNAFASRAALTVLETIEEEGLLVGASTKGQYLHLRLLELVVRYPDRVELTRGLGLLQVLLMHDSADAKNILDNAQSAGLLLTIAGGRGLRFSPALTVSLEELDEGVRLLESVIKANPPCPTS